MANIPSDRVLPSGTVTFLFTDIERSTEVAAALGDEGYAAALDVHRGLLRPAFAAHRGVEVMTEGDLFFVAFERAADAVAAAVAGQRAVEGHRWTPGRRIRVRMGLHTGEALVRGADYVGHEVHRAKRIADAGHGGQILVSQTTADLVSASMIELGPHRLKDLTEPQLILQVVGDGLQAEFPPLRSLDALRTNLPAQGSAFVGREKEIGEVSRLLETNRVVTLTGVGGCGKTRLALQVGAELLDRFTDGVFFADLAPVSDPGLVAQTVARAIGVPLGGMIAATEPGRVDDSVLRFLARRATLVILDNCEHMLDGCADLVAAVVARCPRTTVLATSREPLDVEGEYSWRVPSLSVPIDDAVGDSDAVSLFALRARATRAGFELTTKNIPAVAEICRRLDGMPLAIEFAASRVAHMSPQEIASRLDDMFRLLTGGRRRVQRQQTLQAALDWSFDLLSAPEQAALRRLAVFLGTFTLEAAEGVCAGDEVDARDVLNLLGSLVAKSLVSIGDHHGTTRYRLLETVRQYASEKLREAGEADRYRTRHRDLYLAWSETLSWTDVFLKQDAGTRLAADVANIRAALEWSAGTDRSDLVLRLAARACQLWVQQGHIEEGYRWLTSARAEDVALQAGTRVAALSVAASCANVLQDPAGFALAERAVAAGDVDCEPLVFALKERGFQRAIASQWTGDAELVAGARLDLAHAVAMADALSAEWRAAVRETESASELILGDIAAAAAAAGVAIQLVDPRMETATFGLACLALVTSRHLLGDHDEALAAARAAGVRFVQASGGSPVAVNVDTARFSDVWRSLVVVPLAAALAGAAQRDAARSLLVDALEDLHRSGRTGSIEEIMIGFAVLHAWTGDLPRAARLLGWVRARTIDVGRSAPSQYSYPLYRHYVGVVRAGLDPETARSCRATGRAMSQDEVVADALAS